MNRLRFPFTFDRRFFVLVLSVCLHLRLTLCQQGPPRYRDSSYDNPQQPQGAPNPGDDNYRTYTYNSRRYGQHYIPGSGVGGVYNNRDGSNDDAYRYQVGYNLSFVIGSGMTKRLQLQLLRCVSCIAALLEIALS